MTRAEHTIGIQQAAARALILLAALVVSAPLPATLHGEDQGKLWLIEDFRKKAKAYENEDVQFDTAGVERACLDEKTSITDCRRILRGAEKDLKAKADHTKSEKKRPTVIVIQNGGWDKTGEGRPCGGRVPCTGATPGGAPPSTDEIPQHRQGTKGKSSGEPAPAGAPSKTR